MFLIFPIIIILQLFLFSQIPIGGWGLTFLLPFRLTVPELLPENVRLLCSPNLHWDLTSLWLGWNVQTTCTVLPFISPMWILFFEGIVNSTLFFTILSSTSNYLTRPVFVLKGPRITSFKPSFPSPHSSPTIFYTSYSIFFYYVWNPLNLKTISTLSTHNTYKNYQRYSLIVPYHLFYPFRVETRVQHRPLPSYIYWYSIHHYHDTCFYFGLRLIPRNFITLSR